MNYTTRGNVYERGPITEGMSANGNRWQRMTLVLDVAVGQYTKKVAFQVMTGNVPAVMAFKDGDMVEVTFDVLSRKWTNKEGVQSWFTQVNLLSIVAAEQTLAVPVSSPIPEAGPAQDDDLPFGNL